MGKNSHKHRSSSSSESSDSESSSHSSLSSEDVKVFIKHKHHKKDKCKHSENSSHSESHKDKLSFDDVYKYYKHLLLNDNDFMAGGSNAYLNSANTESQVIPQAYPVNFNTTPIQYNIEHPTTQSPFCVREGGIYIVFFVGTSEQASQYTLFINGLPQLLTTTGNNAGSGQSIFRNMIRLEKDDTVIVRNYLSSSNALQSNTYNGGLLPGNNETFLIMKIASLPCKNKDLDWKPECLSKRKEYLFKKILDKMLLDKELMLKGFNTIGTFYTTQTQTVLTDTDIKYDSSNNVNNLTWSNSNPEQIRINEDGVYKLFFLATTTTSCQFTVFVNNSPVNYSTQGTNKGAGQITIRCLLELNKNDVITVRNYISVNGEVVISKNAGGNYASVSAIVTLFKISPLCKPMPCVIKPNKYHLKCFESFKQFLLHNKNLQVSGSSAYFNVCSTHFQSIDVNQSLSWEITSLKEDVYHKQLTNTLEIKRDGIYDIFVDLIVNESSQLTLFVNGSPDYTTTFGRDSGANRVLMRQFVKLFKGDVIEVRNYDSHGIKIHTPLNTGGNIPGHPCFFMAFLLTPIPRCDDHKSHVKRNNK
jgi:hypothetical protein